ncbi:DnaD domain protein [Weissella halotolerans]|uniref:Replication initiation membrane attachment protein n=1 Tax=Weissella halotolerans DSM 20190 TaxID=1123500 RepID=A0A0R2G8R6_9LACO|nr:DnaD domain protein [Weissella halotolerans]KRN33594.1 replication initiation membrane attachment protein [Weissella halotolerans DSM 20190]
MTEFSLQQKYRIIRDNPLTMTDVQALTKVYLPIIGQTAFTLYLYWMVESPGQKESELLSHTTLLDETGLDHKTFLTARQTLESLGLMKTYRQDLHAGTQWAYELHLPMSMAAFLADKTLTSLLTHFLGEPAVANLVELVRMKRPQINGENVSQSFFDFIGANQFQQIDRAPLSQVEQKRGPVFKLTDDNQRLDMTLISQMLASYQVPLINIKEHEEELVVEKSLYGLSDLDLVRLIQQHLLPNKQLDMKGIRRSLQAGMMKQQRKTKGAISSTDTTSKEKKVQSKSTPQQSKGQALVQLMQTLSPVAFLQAIRQATGGFITDAELKVLEDTAQLNRLPVPVINVALYELTVVEKRSTISKALMQTVVNDWAQANIITVKGALAYLKKRQQNKQSTGRTYRSRGGRQAIKETRPDWEHQKGATVSAAERQRAADKMKQIRERRAQKKDEH